MQLIGKVNGDYIQFYKKYIKLPESSGYKTTTCLKNNNKS